MSVVFTKIILILRKLRKVEMDNVMQNDNLYITLRKF
jgi:hypothetical protein